MKKIRTQTKGIKPLKISGGNDLSIYTFLTDVEYQVLVHFEWNDHRPKLKNDQIEGKHYNIAKRMLEYGGRQDIFLGTRDCQGYVEPCEFGTGVGNFDLDGELTYSLMFHGFDYPDETGKNEFSSRFWRPTMRNGLIEFERPEDCKVRKFIREMTPKEFEQNKNILGCEKEEAL
jgi:CRISPR-associated protein Cas5d